MENIPISKSACKEDGVLLLPVQYLMQIPGKQIRNELIKAFNYWFKISDEKLMAINDIIKTIHSASLLYDDIQDNATLRRGIPVAHAVYGIGSTTNAANYLLTIAVEKILALNHPMACKIYVDETLEAFRGQGMEIYWRDNYVCPTEEEYKLMASRKTGAVFLMAIRLMQLFSDNKSNYNKLVNLLGVYFQIRDDYCSLCSTEYANKKTFCEDITEGKFSFPIIHAIKTYQKDGRILSILKQRTTDFDLKMKFLSLLEESGSLSYTLDELNKMESEILNEIICLSGNPKLESLLKYILTCKLL